MTLLKGAEIAMVPMRDGVRLHTEILIPEKPRDGTRKYPVVLRRGYSPGGITESSKFPEAGYVYVGQCTRGHNLSEGEEGEAIRFFRDADDGFDTLTWIASQPWCDGNIAMYGKSYWGITQWLVAPLQHPNLKAVIPQVAPTRSWKRSYWVNGALSFAMTAAGRAYDKENPEEREKIEKMGWYNYFMHLPLINLDEVMGRNNKLWRDYVTHSSYDDYWKEIDVNEEKLEKINIPVYQTGGWYDHYCGPQFETYNVLRRFGNVPDNRIIINPTDHLNRVYSDRDFGQNADKEEVALAVRWLDFVLYGKENGVKDEPPIKIFVMGINSWKYSKEWPLSNTVFTRYYLHGKGDEGGELNIEEPGDEKADNYVYDPDNPVPTRGGNHSFHATNIPDIIRSGAVDQRPIESRKDVLIYTTPPLEKDVEVTGPVKAVIYAASSARDTDFIVRLTDVFPDGTSYNLVEGNIRARFREDIHGAPVLLEPGKVYKYEIDIMVTSNVFFKGHRIRIHVTSSGFPLYDRNPNTGNPQGMDAEVKTADQVIFHDKQRPSHIVLPVIPVM